MPSPRNVGRWLVAAGLAAILALTCFPSPGDAELAARTPIYCIACGEFGGVDITLNIALFVPFAVGLRLAGWQPRRIAYTCFALSFAIETLQLFALAGRDPSLGDILSNTTGGLVGAWLGARLGSLAAPTPRRAARLAHGGLFLWCAAALLGPVLWVPRFTTRAWWGQWAPRLGMYAPFDGEVRGVTLQGTPIESHRLALAPALRASLDTGAVTLAADAVLGGPVRGLAPIAAVFDEARDEQLLLGQRGRDAVFSWRPRAADLELKRVTVVGPRLLDLPPGTAVHLQATIDRGTVSMLRVSGADSARVRVALTPGRGWRLFSPARTTWFGPGPDWSAAACVLLLLLPIAYWGASAARPARQLLVVASLAGAALLVPLLVGSPAASPAEFLAIVPACLLGNAIARRLAARPALRGWLAAFGGPGTWAAPGASQG